MKMTKQAQTMQKSYYAINDWEYVLLAIIVIVAIVALIYLIKAIAWIFATVEIFKIFAVCFGLSLIFCAIIKAMADR